MDNVETMTSNVNGEIMCLKCNIPTNPGIAIMNTYTGSSDFIGGDIVTMSIGGPGKLIDVLKCGECGHSVTKGKGECYEKDSGGTRYRGIR